MIVSVEKPGTPAELVHVGVKGMKWGVRKQRKTTGSKTTGKEEPFWTPQRKSTAKKVAIATAALVVVAGAAYVAYKLHQNGKLPLSSAKLSPKAAPAVKKVFDSPTDILYSSRGKTKGYQFFKSGGVPNPDAVAARAFGQGQAAGFFRKLEDGTVAAVLPDAKGRIDQAGRPIVHDLIVPKSMASGIDTIEDVKQKIWPLVKDLYDHT